MNDLINDGQGEPVTRREYRERMGIPSPDPEADRNVYINKLIEGLEPVYDAEIYDPPSFIAKSRKALAALVGGFAAAAGPLIVAATADGVVSWEGEIVPALVVGAGAGIGLGLSVWAIRND